MTFDDTYFTNDFFLFTPCTHYIKYPYFDSVINCSVINCFQNLPIFIAHRRKTYSIAPKRKINVGKFYLQRMLEKYLIDENL